MTNPIFRNEIQDVSLQGTQSAIPMQQVPGGFADVPTTIDQAPGEPCQSCFYFFQRIFAFLCSIVNAIKNLLCCSKKETSGDKISDELAGFNNTGVQGQINGIYITTNETNLEALRQTFREQPRPVGQTIHIGCATWHNLDIMCARRSTYGLIVDFNPKNAEFIRKTIDLIVASESRDAFKRGMIEYLHSLTGSERDLFFHADQRGQPTDRIEQELLREGSWLQNDENYLYVKQELVSKGRLIPIVEDIRDSEKFASIREFLDGNQIFIDTLYMSNISNFMRTPNDRTGFVQSIRQLLHRDTIFINCPRIIQGNQVTILSQRAILGRDILEGSYPIPELFERAARL